MPRSHVEGPEIPAGDGSSAEFATAIAACGLEIATRNRAKCCEIDAPLWLRASDRMIAAFPSPSVSRALRRRFRTARSARNTSTTKSMQNATERRLPARARSRYLHEVEALWARGLGRGGSLENALVFTPDGPMQPLRWPNEAVRHKVLDLVGDLALLGAWPQCEIVAFKSGHELHASMTRVLRSDCPYRRHESLEEISLTELDIRMIFEILPHRYPMLLVDRIVEFEPMVRVNGYKNITYNEQIFAGPFPQQPGLARRLHGRGPCAAGGRDDFGAR